jgi:predicted DNA-binding protein YlxM (UPF0122 family)
LLSDHKKRIFEDYVLNDLSLSEIAEQKGISRQGVYDIVRRCSQELREYESKLLLAHKFRSIIDKINNIKEILQTTKDTGNTDQIHEIEQLADEILKEL